MRPNDSILHRVFSPDFAPGQWTSAALPSTPVPGSAILRRAAAVAASLSPRVRGEPVLLRGALSPRWAVAFFGLSRAGAIVVPVARAAAVPELEHIATDTGARFAIDADAPASSLRGGVLERLESLDLAAAEGAAGEGVDPSAITRPLDGVAASDPLMVVYTSGTTGAPKGAVLSHGSVAAQTAVLRDAWAIDARDTLLHALPMHHVHGVTVAFLTAFTAGASVLHLERFDAVTALSAMRGATVFMAVPTMWSRIVEAVDASADPTIADGLRALRLFTSGSAALPASLAERVRAIAGVIPLERYGMTEIGMALSNPLDPSGRKLGSVGTPLPTVEARIVDERGEVVDGDGKPGGLQIRGPSVFTGYWGDASAHHAPKGCAPARSSAQFHEGWFVTGDVAQRDAEGHVRLLGRASVDILKTGGEKVSALELEEMLREHPDVADVAVIGVPDDHWGERVVAVVVARGDVTEEDLRGFARTRVAPFKVPKEVRFVAELPRNAMGKVQKSRLGGSGQTPSGDPK